MKLCGQKVLKREMIAVALAVNLLIALGNIVQANGKTYTFSPNLKMLDEKKIDNIIDNDEVSVYAPGNSPLAGKTDIIEWIYKYENGYKVASDDLANVGKLELWGTRQGGTTTDVTLKLLDCNNKQVGKLITWRNIKWKLPNVKLVSKGGLGKLKDLCVAGFHLTVTVTGGDLRLTQVYFVWDAYTIKKVKCSCKKTAHVGGDPPIYRNIMAFPTPERFIGSDLNGDGDTNDTILRYQNLETGEVVSTGLNVYGAYHAIDIYENIIAFVGEDLKIRYYDINTNKVGETGATGSYLSIYGNIIVFSSEGTICYFDLSTQTLVDTEVTGCGPVIYRDMIVFHAFDQKSTIWTYDFVFHAFDQKSTIWTYDLCTGVAVDTSIIGRSLACYETMIAFVISEFSVIDDLNGDGDTSDWLICYYDLESHTLLNTRAIGRYPAIFGNRITFTTPEEDVNQDLNGDGKILGNVIRYYDINANEIVNTHELGTEPDIYNDTITFYVWEHWINRDLDGDGNFNDPIVDTYQINLRDPAVENLDTSLVSNAEAGRRFISIFFLYINSIILEKFPGKIDETCVEIFLIAFKIFGGNTTYFKIKGHF